MFAGKSEERTRAMRKMGWDPTEKKEPWSIKEKKFGGSSQQRKYV